MSHCISSGKLLPSQFDVWVSSVSFVNGLYIGISIAVNCLLAMSAELPIESLFSIAVNCLLAMSAELPIESLFSIHMHKNDGLQNYLPKKKKFWYFFIPGRFCLTRVNAGVGLHFLEAPGWSRRYHMCVNFDSVNRLLINGKHKALFKSLLIFLTLYS